MRNSPTQVDGGATLAEPRNPSSSEFLSLARLHELGTRCVGDGNLSALLDEVLEAVVAVTHAARGHIQLLDGSTGRLHIVAQRGLSKAFIDFFNGRGTVAAACTAALTRRTRVIVEDVRTSSAFSDDAKRVMLDSGGLTCLATPLTSRDGDVIGILSTQFEGPHRCSDEQLRLV